MVGRIFGLALVAAIGAATPALADVKAGVDAWSAGRYADAVREWVEPAREGDADAQFNLAQAYRLGRGVAADPEQAEALYAAAAAQGHLQASDNYGLMLFQRGERERALPYVQGAADRGDPRAQYLMGVAHFNGDLVEKDWTRAYALVTIADNTGLPQARGAMAQMDEYIPLETRQAAQVMAAQIKADADSNRARQLATVDLTRGAPVAVRGPEMGPDEAVSAGRPEPVDDTRVVLARVNEPAPVTPPVAPPAPVQVAAAPPSRTVPQPTAAVPATTAPTASVGPWKVQLGSFRMTDGPDRMWSRVSRTAAFSGAQKLTRKSGALTVLFAEGFATRADAAQACAALKRSGSDCLVTR